MTEPPRLPVLLTMTAEHLNAAEKNHGVKCARYKPMAAMLATSDCANCGYQPRAHVVNGLIAEIRALSAALQAAEAENKQLHTQLRRNATTSRRIR